MAKVCLKSHFDQQPSHSSARSPLLFFKKLVSPSVERKCASSPTPERGRTTPRHRQERRGRERGAENKENVAAHSKGGDLFALPPPRTPVSSKKNARQKNVLTTPNQTSNGHAATPKGESSLPPPPRCWRWRVCCSGWLVEWRKLHLRAAFLRPFTVLLFPCLTPAALILTSAPG